MMPSNSRWKRLRDRTLHEWINALEYRYLRLKARVYYRHVFRSFGEGSLLFKPILLSNPHLIEIGSGVSIRNGVRLEAIVSDSTRPPSISIGDNVLIEQNVQIICHSRLRIGNSVSIAGHCAIVDVTHPYQDVHDSRKIGDRILPGESWVEIGDGSFIGFGALILPRVKIGNYCIVGGNAVVTRDVPDFSVVAGNPAKVLRRYDHSSGEWIAV